MTDQIECPVHVSAYNMRRVFLFRCFISLHQKGGFERVVSHSWVQLWTELRIRAALKSSVIRKNVKLILTFSMSQRKSHQDSKKIAGAILRFYLSVFLPICDLGSVEKCEVVKSKFLLDRRLQTVSYKTKGPLNAGLHPWLIYCTTALHQGDISSIWLLIRLHYITVSFPTKFNELERHYIFYTSLSLAFSLFLSLSLSKYI